MIKQGGSFLQQYLSKAKQLNKLVMWVAGGIIGILLIVAALSLQGPDVSKKKVDAGQASIAQGTDQVIEALPANYSDMQKIRTYLRKDNSQFKNALGTLRQQTQQLQQQINQLKQQPTQPTMKAPVEPTANLGQQDQQAARSTLFFSGAVPTAPKESKQSIGKRLIGPVTLAQSQAAVAAAAKRRERETAQNMREEDAIQQTQDKSANKIYNEQLVDYPRSHR